MCGIIGYIGDEKCWNVLFEGLRRMEYRGYDSYGFAVLNENGIKLKKSVGKIGRAENREIKGECGIAHTRWATHGDVSEKNAHPHTDCRNEIAIVHNGIIENFSALKNILEKEGHAFSSETDSEIIAHLIEKYYEGDIADAVRKVVMLLEGTYGLIVMHANEKKLVCAKNGSPVIIGVGKNENIAASDAAAIVGLTKDIIYLEDGQMAVLTKNGIKITDKSLNSLPYEIKKIEWTTAEIEKGGYKHFMLKEIKEQKDSIKNTIRGRIKDGEIKISVDIDGDFLRQMNRMIITACGTSWHAALVGKYFIERICRIPVEVDYASEFRYKNPLASEKTLLVTISQSGETADTLAALKEAKKKGAKTIGIINVVGSSIARESDSGIYIHAGPEIGVASTKAFTGQIMALLLFSLYINQKLGRKNDQTLISEIGDISKLIEKALSCEEEAKKIARKFYEKKNALYLGRGINFPVALEGALKLKEISYIHAEGYPAAEMKHGPIALVDEDMPVFFLIPAESENGGLRRKIIGNMQEIKARKGIVISVASLGDKEIEEVSDYVIHVPRCREELSPIINVIPLQLVAYYIADMKGLDPDKPKNLAKSVTVE